MKKATALLLLAITVLSTCTFTQTAATLPTENSWTQKAPLNHPRSNLAAAAVNGKLYTFGGMILDHQNTQEVVSRAIGTTEMYDSTADKWTDKADMPTARYDFAAAAYQGKIYCFSGCTGVSFTHGEELTAATEVYDPTTNTWQNRTALPYAQKGAQAVVVGDKIYVMGGFPNKTVNQMYDPVTDTWTLKAALPTQVYSGWDTTWTLSHYVAVDGKIYAFGNYYMSRPQGWLDNYYPQINGNILQNTYNSLPFLVPATKIYDPQSDNWTTSSPPPSTLGSCAAATTGFMAPPMIFFFSNSQTVTFNPETQTWSSAAPIPSLLGGAIAATCDDVIYVMGGSTLSYPNLYSGGVGGEITYSGAVYAYTPFGYAKAPPTITVHSPQSGNYASGTFTVNYSTNRQIMTTYYSLDGAENVTAAANSTLTLQKGTHTLTFYALDVYRNTGTSGPITLNIEEPSTPVWMWLLAVAAVVAFAAALTVTIYFKKH